MVKWINILDIIYPEGSFYITTNSISPASIIGGNWELLDPGTFLCCAGEGYELGSSGGKEEVFLSIPQLPKFGINVPTTVNGKITGTTYNGISSTGYQWFTTSTKRTNTIYRPWKNNDEGDYRESEMGQSHDNLPPYFAVYIYHRIS